MLKYQSSKFYDVDLIKVLTGVRRCGKSVLLSQIEEELRSIGYNEEHIIKVNFEDLQFEKIRNAEGLNKYVIDHIKDDERMQSGEESGDINKVNL